MSTPAPVGSVEFGRLVLCLLFQNRMATNEQLHQLTAPRSSKAWIRSQLADLRDRGLVDYVEMPGKGRMRTYWLTEQGRSTTSEYEEVRGRSCPPPPADPFAARMRTKHTLEVLRTHVAFLNDARERHDEFGPLDWAPEIYHRVAEQGAEALIADALMRYTVSGPPRALHRAFVEVDRATMSSEALASKLLAYARFQQLVPVPARQRGTVQAQSALPAWQHHYPSFPRILFVLTGAGPEAQLRRVRDLQALARKSPLVVRMLQEVRAGVAGLEEIEERGPSAPVWASLADPERPACGWMEL